MGCSSTEVKIKVMGDKRNNSKTKALEQKRRNGIQGTCGIVGPQELQEEFILCFRKKKAYRH
jgi:hypothetical protein